MTAGQQVSQYVAYEQWNEALLDELLPELPQELHGAPVLLSCDDDAVARAGARWGYEPEDAMQRLARSVELKFHIANTGSIEAVRRPAVQFKSAPDRARKPPPFLAVCALMVLAASRMTADEDGGTTAAYYRRLWEVLGATPRRRPPYEFDYAPCLFEYLAQWLERDLAGRRGRLILRREGPSQIGCAINQCLFRQRDKEHLALFFAHRLSRGSTRFDLLRLLQVSPERHHLTKRALAVVSDLETSELARSALEQTYRDWDGTVPDAHGGRSWRGALRLSVNRQLRLAVIPPPTALEDETGFEELILLPLFELPTLATSGWRTSRAGGRGVFVPLTGDTLIFEMSEDNGLVWVRAPSQERVFVLTADRDLQRSLADALVVGRGTSELPMRWQLFERVDVTRLPKEITSRVASVRPPVALAGGLRVANGWLVGSPPRLEAGEVEGTLNVAVDGRWVAELRCGGEFQLTLGDGDHEVDVGDGLVSFTVRMFNQHPARPAYGELASSLDAHGLRAGACIAPRKPFVCGAAMSESYDGSVPLLFRSAGVSLITTAGVGLRAEKPATADWLRAVGLDPDVARWQLEPESDIAWVLAGRRVVMLREVLPEQLDGFAQLAVQRAGARPEVRSGCEAPEEQACQMFGRLRALADGLEPEVTA